MMLFSANNTHLYFTTQENPQKYKIKCKNIEKVQMYKQKKVSKVIRP